MKISELRLTIEPMLNKDDCMDCSVEQREWARKISNDFLNYFESLGYCPEFKFAIFGRDEEDEEIEVVFQFNDRRISFDFFPNNPLLSVYHILGARCQTSHISRDALNVKFWADKLISIGYEND